MASITHDMPRLLEQAQQAYSRSDWSAAEKLLTIICEERQLQHDLPWAMLGTVRSVLGQYPSALNCFLKASKLAPDNAEHRNNLALTYHKTGNIELAEVAFRQALEQKPDYIHAAFNLGLLLLGRERLHEAENLFLQVLKYSPGHAGSLCNLGLINSHRAQFSNALEYYNRALDYEPDNVQALNNKAAILVRQNRYDLAEECYQLAIQHAPDSAELMDNLGLLYAQRGEPDRAIVLFKRAIKLQADFVNAYIHLADVYRRSSQLSLAEKSVRQALKISPDSVDAWNSLGATRFRQADLVTAAAAYSSAIALQSDNNVARYNLASIHLLNQNYTQGWDLYRWRPAQQAALLPPPPEAPLDTFDRRTLQVSAEQGLGDQLFFLRFAYAAAERGQKLQIELDSRLLPLVSGLHQNIRFVPALSHTHRTADVALGDLPYLFSRLIPSNPAPVQVNIDLARQSAWHKELGKTNGEPLIGVCWQAGEDLNNRLYKRIDPYSIGLALRKLPGRIVVLQRNPSATDLDAFAEGLHRPFANLHHLNEDLPNLVAMLSCIDHYVGVSSTNVHILAGMGKPATVICSTPPEWRWQTTCPQSSWFPTVDLMRIPMDNQTTQLPLSLTDRIRSKLSTNQNRIFV